MESEIRWFTITVSPLRGIAIFDIGTHIFAENSSYFPKKYGTFPNGNADFKCFCC